MTKRKISQIKVGAVVSYLSIAINILGGLLYTPWMIDQIGKSDYGIYTLANSLITLFLIDFGLSSATSRFVAKYRAENDEEGLQNFLSAVYKLYMIIDAVIFAFLLTVFFFIDVIYQKLSTEEIEKFKIVYCIAATYSLINFPCVTFNGILTAYEKFIPLKLADISYKIGSIIFTIIALICKMGLYSLVTINALCGLATIAVKFLFVRKNVRFSLFKKTKDKHIFKEIFSFSIWTTVWTLAQRLIFNITPTILGITVVAASSAIALFGIVTTIESYIYLITTAINGMFLARITSISLNDSDGKKLTALAVKIGRFQIVINGLIIVTFALIGKDFMMLWMGNDYIDAYYCILLVIIPGLFYNSLQILITASIALNLVKYQALIHIVMGLSNLVLSLIFSSLWGVLGASISIFISYIIRQILTIIFINKKLNVNFKEYSKECYLKMLIPIVVALLLGFLAIINFTTVSWFMFVVKGAIIVLIFSAVLFVLGLKREEKNIILSKLKIKKHR